MICFESRCTMSFEVCNAAHAQGHALGIKFEKFFFFEVL